MNICWCGNTELVDFGPSYSECKACGTLVSREGLPPEQLHVRDDALDFYGKKYWLEHQNEDLGFPDIFARARSDLTERNLHWLKSLLKFCLPPAVTLELGCSHGSFVALQNLAGYAATGLELSSWVVEFGKQAFDIPLLTGPIETQNLPPKHYDAILLMDVLEHLQSPSSTMEHCLTLLKKDGILLIQTPCFKEEKTYQLLVENNDPFLEQLKANEHLFLFSERAIKTFFERLGAPYLHFEPAIFYHYDMFFSVSRSPLRCHAQEDAESALLATPNGRIALALLDIRERELFVNADREARGVQIETLTKLVHESEVDRAARGEQIETLTKMVHTLEAEQATWYNQLGKFTYKTFSKK